MVEDAQDGLRLQEVADMSGEIREIPLNIIDFDPEQPRKKFEGIDELARNITSNGLLQYPIFFETDDGRYQVVVGERRVRAVMQTDCQTIRGLLRPEFRDPAKRRIIQLIENVHRKDLNSFELAEAYDQLNREGLTHERIAKIVGIGRTDVTRHLCVLRIPPELRDECANLHIPDYKLRELARQKTGQPMLAWLEAYRERASRPKSKRKQKQGSAAEDSGQGNGSSPAAGHGEQTDSGDGNERKSGNVGTGDSESSSPSQHAAGGQQKQESDSVAPLEGLAHLVIGIQSAEEIFGPPPLIQSEHGKHVRPLDSWGEGHLPQNSVKLGVGWGFHAEPLEKQHASGLLQRMAGFARCYLDEQVGILAVPCAPENATILHKNLHLEVGTAADDRHGMVQAGWTFLPTADHKGYFNVLLLRKPHRFRDFLGTKVPSILSVCGEILSRPPSASKMDGLHGTDGCWWRGLVESVTDPGDPVLEIGVTDISLAEVVLHSGRRFAGAVLSHQQDVARLRRQLGLALGTHKPVETYVRPSCCRVQ